MNQTNKGFHSPEYGDAGHFDYDVGDIAYFNQENKWGLVLRIAEKTQNGIVVARSPELKFPYQSGTRICMAANISLAPQPHQILPGNVVPAKPSAEFFRGLGYRVNDEVDPVDDEGVAPAVGV